MSVTQANGVCPAVLIGMEELANPTYKLNKTAIGLEALLDAENTRGVTIEQLNNGQGHEKTVRVKYKQRQTVSDVGESKTCTTGTEKPYLEDTFNVTQTAEIKLELSEADVRLLCKAQSDYVSIPAAMRSTSQQAQSSLSIMRELAEEVYSDLDALRVKVNQSLLEAVALNFGRFADTDAFKLYKTLKSENDHSIVTAAFNKMKEDLRKIGFTGTPYVVGNSEIYFTMESLGIGCCNDGGSDIAKLASSQNMKFYYDMEDFNSYFGADVSGATPFYMFYPKMLQLVQYNKYVGDFATPIGTMSRGTLPDPQMAGLTYDMRLLPNECNESYTLFIDLDYDFWAAPLNLFKSGDRLANVNGILKGYAGYVS